MANTCTCIEVLIFIINNIKTESFIATYPYPYPYTYITVLIKVILDSVYCL